MTKEIKEKLKSIALENLGKPYKYGAKPQEAPNTFDCSSFVQYVYKQIGIELPRTSLEQAHCGAEISKDQLEIGDLIFLKGSVGRYDNVFKQGVGHVEMYIGDNKLINARYKQNEDGSDGGVVEIADADKELQREDLVIIKRIL